MNELLETLRDWQAEGVAVGRAVVIRTFGSAPRPEGAVLLATADGRLAGSVSGGCVEGAAYEEIERARRDGVARVIRYGISDEQAWDVGLACGGTIDVLVEPRPARGGRRGARGGRRRRRPRTGDRHPAPGRRARTRLRPARPRRGRAGRRHRWSSATTETCAGVSATRRSTSVSSRRVAAPSPAAHRRPSSSAAASTSSRPTRSGRDSSSSARSRSRSRSCAMARELGFETVVVDGRAAFATPARFPDVDRLVVGWPDEVAEEIGLGPADAVAVLTHDVKFDEPAIVEALRRGCRYVGAVGSRKTQADRRARLLAAGVDRGRARPAARSDRARPGRRAPRPRRPSRSWPRSSPIATPGAVARCASWRPPGPDGRSGSRSEEGRRVERGATDPKIVPPSQAVPSVCPSRSTSPVGAILAAHAAARSVER